MSDEALLLDPQFLHRLEALALAVRRRRAGQFQGNRRSPRHGASVEFADYRDYVRGDDLRRVDWNIYARLERPFVKLFEEEEDLSVHLLLDGSRSMDWEGDPDAAEGADAPPSPTNKWLYARRTAAALGYIALSGGDRLQATVLQQDIPVTEARFGPTRGKGQTLGLLRFLSALEARGPTDLNETLRTYSLASRATRPGLVILISDLLSPTGYEEGLSALLARGHEGLVIHTLTPQEVDPPLSGALELVDVESGEGQAVTIDARTHALYRARVSAWQEQIQRWCAQRRVTYVPITTDIPFDELILYHLRRRGLLA